MSIAQNLLKIRIADEFFGVDSDRVDQILRVQPITKVPLSNSSMLGISVIAGKVVPVLDLAILLNFGRVDVSNEKTRLIIVKKDDELVGFLLDEVLETLSVNEANYEANTNDEDAIKGFYKDDAQIVQVLDPVSLIIDGMISSFEPISVEALAKSDEGNMDSEYKNTSDESKRALFFKVKNETFAFELDFLRELIFVPSSITTLADSPYANIGAITLRGELISVFDFNMLMGFGETPITDKSRFLILQYNNRALAVSVESVDEIKDMASSRVEQAGGAFTDSKVGALYKERDGSIVSIISNDYLKELVLKYSLGESADAKDKNKEKSIQESVDMLEIAVFAIAGEEFAFDIEDVQEIIRHQDITPIPDAPMYLEGIINLRGSVVPIVSLPERLGYQKNITDKSKIVVCMNNGEKIGFMVDDVNEILFVEDRFVSKSKNGESLIRETITLEDGNRIILKLNMSKILTDEMIEKLKNPLE